MIQNGREYIMVPNDLPPSWSLLYKGPLKGPYIKVVSKFNMIFAECSRLVPLFT